MDGYALHAADLVAGAAPRVLRRIAAGDAAGPAIGPGEAVRVLTGAPVPPGAAAVVMEEHVALRDGRVEPRRLLRPGANIRRLGEDLAAGEILLPPGTRLDARHLALLAAAGGGRVPVRRRVRVALLSNGNELGATIRDSNRPMLAALLARPEVALTDLGVLPDDPAALAAALGQAARDHDLILASGGVSGSDADHLPRALRAAGGAVEVLKLAQKPGKPLAHGRLGDALCLFLPGNPLAALVGFLTLGRPLLARLSGAMDETGPAPLAAVAARGFSRKPGREEFLPARIVGQDGCRAAPARADRPLRLGPAGAARRGRRAALGAGGGRAGAARRRTALPSLRRQLRPGLRRRGMDLPLPPDGDALHRLVAGFGRFRHSHFEADHDLYDRLLDGQRPEVMVIACSDSRTDPAIICGAKPGELFVVRNVAALVPPHDPDGRPHGTASAIEFGVRALGVRHIVVLGHSFCAGVRCLLGHGHAPGAFDYVSDWVGVAREVRDEMDGLVTEADRLLVARRAEQATVLASLRHLATYPFIAARVASGRLDLHGWYFHFGWGVLQAAVGPRGPFRQVDGAAPPPAIGATANLEDIFP